MGNLNGPVPGLEWLHRLIDPVASGGNLGFRLAFAADKLRGTEVLPVFHYALGGLASRNHLVADDRVINHGFFLLPTRLTTALPLSVNRYF